jgi:hypothetical protein
VAGLGRDQRRGAGDGLAEVSQLRGDTAEPIVRYRQATALLCDAAEGGLARQARVAPDADHLPPYTRPSR